MPRPRLPHLRHERNRHGDWCWYFRRENGPRVRIKAAFGTPEFNAEYNAARDGKSGEAPVKRSGTLAWLIDRYKRSGEFADLRASTRAVRDRQLRALLKESGSVQFINIKRKHIQDAMDRRAATPHAANNLLTVLTRMFRWAVENEHVETNPCDTVRRRAAKSDGFHTWTLEEVAAYRDKHPIGTMARLALDLLLFVGLRGSDVVRLGRQHVKDDVATIRTVKTGTVVSVPIFEELRASIDATATVDLTFLSHRGRPFSAHSFGAWFRKQCDAAGLPHCTAHGLRKAGATIAANHGATARQLMAMYGWNKLAMAEQYTRAVDQAGLAREAAERIANGIPPHQNESAAADPEKTANTG